MRTYIERKFSNLRNLLLGANNFETFKCKNLIFSNRMAIFLISDVKLNFL